MIRPLKEQDHSATGALLAIAPAYTLYLLGNIQALGFGSHFCQYWGDFDDGGSLRGVINRYMSGWSIFGLPGADWTGLMALLDAHSEVTRLQDNPGGIESVLGFLTRYRPFSVHDEELMTLQPDDFRPAQAVPGVIVRRATLGDLPQLVDLYADAGDMSRSPAAVERPLRDSRVWIALAGASLLSAALTNAETSQLAMIGGVYTPPAERGQGLSAAVCSALCSDLLRDGKEPVLYWKYPPAGRLYALLGFRPIGRWRSVWLDRNQNQ